MKKGKMILSVVLGTMVLSSMSLSFADSTNKEVSINTVEKEKVSAELIKMIGETVVKSTVSKIENQEMDITVKFKGKEYKGKEAINVIAKDLLENVKTTTKIESNDELIKYILNYEGKDELLRNLMKDLEIVDVEKEEVLTKDVIVSEWAKPFVDNANELNLLKGIQLGKSLDLTETITREEFTEITMKYVKSIVGKSKLDSLKSLDNVSSYADTKNLLVIEASELGIIRGVDEDTVVEKQFLPKKKISRQEVSVIISRANKIIIETEIEKETKENVEKGLEIFKDNALIEDWARVEVFELVKSGVIKGFDTGNFEPKGNTTKEQAIKIIIEDLNSKKVK